MKAMYGSVETKTSKILIAVVVIVWLILIAALMHKEDWTMVSCQFASIFSVSYLLYNSRRAAVRITENDRLIIKGHCISVGDIVSLEKTDASFVRAHYSFQGESRKSARIKMREEDIDALFSELRKINPHITIN
ncbi:hypothetical protein LJC44_05585 [Parabacteroides sp. OttesenSCG-928-G06]|nr:hypothetical protein [Parabacteroides sp. OttesenSCG-928-G06]